jgi:RimJ/RimL family protein N-acetyltransferase
MTVVLGPALETERLILRPPVAADLDGWAELMGDPAAARFIGGQMARSPAWRTMATVTGSWALNGFGMFSVVEKATGRWIGRVGPWRPEGWPGAELAWGLHPAFHGKGYAVEAASAAMDWIVDYLGWDEVIHSIDPENEASKKVAVRLGSRLLRMGHLPEPYHEKALELWGQGAEDWKARRA